MQKQGHEDEARRLTAAEVREEMRGTWLFFAVLMIVIVAVFAISLYADPSLRQPRRLIPFALLVALHLALYWFSPYLVIQRRLMVPFFLFQGVLIFAINLLAVNQAMIYGLYLPLVGAAVGFLEDVRLGVLAAASCAGLATLNFGLQWGWESVPGWLTLFLPLMLFVVIYVVAFDRQARARKQAQDLLRELEVAHGKLAAYAAQVEELTLTAERQRMARELHDTLAQGLAGLVLQMEALDSHLAQHQLDEAQAIVRQAMRRARGTLADARRAITDLRSEAFPRRGLVDVLRQESERFSAATGIPCHVQLSLEGQVPQTTAEQVQRAVAEGLLNVARHAQASHVWLELVGNHQELRMTLRDDGVGFDPHRVDREGGHYGLLGLRERARLAGGAFDVDSSHGEGSTLVLVLPLQGGEQS
jgi:NarL family two-component system sensor histidine kinase YdfH